MSEMNVSHEEKLGLPRSTGNNGQKSPSTADGGEVWAQ